MNSQLPVTLCCMLTRLQPLRLVDETLHHFIINSASTTLDERRPPSTPSLNIVGLLGGPKKRHRPASSILRPGGPRGRPRSRKVLFLKWCKVSSINRLKKWIYKAFCRSGSSFYCELAFPHASHSVDRATSHSKDSRKTHGRLTKDSRKTHERHCKLSKNVRPKGCKAVAIINVEELVILGRPYPRKKLENLQCLSCVFRVSFVSLS